MQVKAERSGWRDPGISARHRSWGWDCPAADLDFLEYNCGTAVCLVEYKHEYARMQDPKHPTVKALVDLGTRANIPVLGVRYASDFSWWRVVPLNDHARTFLPERDEMTEREYVSLLYKMRGREMPPGLFENDEI